MDPLINNGVGEIWSSHAGNSMTQTVTGTHDWPNFLAAFARTPGIGSKSGELKTR
jgi:hypothetical protein